MYSDSDSDGDIYSKICDKSSEDLSSCNSAMKMTKTPVINNICSVSSYDGDADDDSLSSALSDMYIGFQFRTDNIPQIYPYPVFQQGSYRVKSICGNDERAMNAEILGKVGDSDYDNCSINSDNSTDDLISYVSAIELLQTTIIQSNLRRFFDFLSSFPVFVWPLPCPYASRPGRLDTLPLVPLFSSQMESSLSDSQPSNGPSYGHNHDSNSTAMRVSRIRDNDRNLNRSFRGSSILSSDLSFSHTPAKASDSKELKLERRESISPVFASAPLDSASQPSLNFTSSGESIPTAVAFTNQRLERTHYQQPSVNFPSRLPSDLTHTSSEESTPVVNKFTNDCLQEQRSSPNIHMPVPSLFYKSSQVSHSSNTILSSSSTSPTSIDSCPLTMLNKPYTTAQSVESLPDNMSHSSDSLRIQQIKRKLRSMEIKHYRQKSIRSMQTSRIHCANININRDNDYECDNLSIYSDLYVSHHSNDKVVSVAKSVSENGRKIMCFNLATSTVCMLFALYNVSLSQASS